MATYPHYRKDIERLLAAVSSPSSVAAIAALNEWLATTRSVDADEYAERIESLDKELFEFLSTPILGPPSALMNDCSKAENSSLVASSIGSSI